MYQKQYKRNDFTEKLMRITLSNIVENINRT